jgi:CBS domain containing-hemolysin-like protein
MKLFSWLQDAKSQDPESVVPDHSMAPALEARLIELDKLSVREAMIPRSVMMALDVDVQLRRVRRLKSAKTLYFPVYKGDLDHVLGWISKSKVLELMNDTTDEVQLAKHIRPAGEVSETATAATLAEAFLKSSSPLLVVKNAQGGTAGVIPLSEYVELLFGFDLAPSELTPSTDLSSNPPRSYEV